MQYWHETVICNLKHDSVPTIVHQRYRLHTTQVLSSHYCTGNNTTQHNTTQHNTTQHTVSHSYSLMKAGKVSASLLTVFKQ